MEDNKIKFTAEQQAVIDARDSNILVSAAAGSGKTAVLVERIIQMVEGGLDVDHLLVVTFTKAAAGQMKEKITQAIQKRLLEDPENAHLQRQETLIHNAQITTIDSFCQYIIRNNFGAIGLDPAFRVGDEGELKIIMEDVMDELLEDEYGAARDCEDSDFLFCMDYFSPGSNDRKAPEYIRQLFKYSMSMPWPEDWISERAGDFNESGEHFDELPWVKSCMSYASYALKEASMALDSAIHVSCEPDGPYMYTDQLETEKASIDAALQYDTYDALFTGLSGISFAALSRKKDDSVNSDKREYIKSVRDGVKKDIAGLREKYFALPSGTIIAQMKLCDRAVRELCRLTLEFKRRFDEKKRQMQLIDFSDMEHFALQILVDHEKGEPSGVALEYREFYREVLIDEYQDSNSVQEMILMAIAGQKAGVSERFMVGDVKQSIYKFRLARPELFMEKFHSYDKAEGAADRRIDLHRNFRSRSEVLDITNYIFEKIMGADLGGVDYDEDARLVAGASYDAPSMDVSPELLLLDGSDTLDDEESEIADLSDRQKEALAIAERIKRLIQENPGLKYSDIVILLRSLSGWDDVFADVLESQQIPVYIESKSGYFEAQEVAVLLQLLSVIDNPRQDIPLISVMHSAIGAFTDEELALIRIAINKSDEGGSFDSFYEGMCSELELPDALSRKLSAFIEMIEDFRRKTTYTPVHELLLDILDTTGFETFVTAMPGGNQRRANIEMLLGYAMNFEKTSFKGLFHFVRYIEHMRVSMVDYGEAGTIDENADVVRIMSIHKSKGLEFPVVFVSGLSKKFNRMDTRGDLIVDVDLGIGVKCIDSELRVKYDTLKRQIIADKMDLDCLGEEIRVLYVALTRAKEKLIMTSFCSDLSRDLQKALGRLPLFASSGALLPYSTRSRAMSFFDLILPAVIRHPAFRAVIEKYELDTDEFDSYRDISAAVPLCVTEIGEKDLKEEMVTSAASGILRLEELKSAVLAAPEGDLYKRLTERFTAKYPHENLKGLFTKTTVSEVKKAAIEKIEESRKHAEYSTGDKVVDVVGIDKDENQALVADKGLMPDSANILELDEDAMAEAAWFAENEGYTGKPHLKGAERGTAYHRVMELLDGDIYGDEDLMNRVMDEARQESIVDQAIDEDDHRGMTKTFSNESGKEEDNLFGDGNTGIRNEGHGDKKLGAAARQIYAWIKGMEKKGRISEEAGDCVWTPDVVKFLASDVGQRMGRAFRRGELSREKPFMMGVSAKELDVRFPEDEMVLVQGIIDAFFIEDGEIALLDYKTDRVPDDQTLVDLYKVQLALYKRALEAATGLKVRECLLYSFALGRQIAVEE